MHDSICDFLVAAKQNTYASRGPSEYIDGKYTYHNIVNGGFEEFHGCEYITSGSEKVYTLQYSGGSLR